MIRFLQTIALILAIAGLTLSEESKPPAPQVDPLTGMIIAKDWELVRAHCIACHSPQQFLRQRGTRQTWQSVVDWMQKDHGLVWLTDPETERRIVDYLTTHYAPDPGNYRRAPIPATLRPPNPYVSAIEKALDARPRVQ